MHAHGEATADGDEDDGGEEACGVCEESEEVEKAGAPGAHAEGVGVAEDGEDTDAE